MDGWMGGRTYICNYIGANVMYRSSYKLSPKSTQALSAFERARGVVGSA